MLTHEMFESLLPLTSASCVASCNPTAISVCEVIKPRSLLFCFTRQQMHSLCRRTCGVWCPCSCWELTEITALEWDFSSLLSAQLSSVFSAGVYFSHNCYLHVFLQLRRLPYRIDPSHPALLIVLWELAVKLWLSIDNNRNRATNIWCIPGFLPGLPAANSMYTSPRTICNHSGFLIFKK